MLFLGIILLDTFKTLFNGFFSLFSKTAALVLFIETLIKDKFEKLKYHINYLFLLILDGMSKM